MNKAISDIRQEYLKYSLDETEVEKSPFLQFQIWFDEAQKAEVSEVNAFALATVDLQNKPHNRIVLLKGIENNSFLFFTNYESHKGKQIETNPNVEILFFWKELERQVRISGTIQKLSEKESDNYFFLDL